MQADIKDALSGRYGAECDFPGWTKPFLHAVGLMNKLADIDEEIRDMDHGGDADTLWEASREVEEADEDAGSGDGVSLLSVGDIVSVCNVNAYVLEKKTSEESESEVQDVQALVLEAEEHLLSAIVLSHEKEALPSTWIAILYMGTEDWPNARDAATSAVNLEPLQPLSLIRLSICYDNERDFVKAYDTLRKGVGLLPPAEREPHKAKLAHLQEQRNDALANVSRVDPFERLPLEVIINIMQHGLKRNRHFVLRCSWVSKTWNRILVHNCPELWGTLICNWRELKDKSWHAKRQLWIIRADNKIHTVDIDFLNSTSVAKIIKSYEPYFRKARIVRITMQDSKALGALFKRFDRAFCAAEHLYIYGGEMHGYPNEEDAIEMLDCNLLNPDIVKDEDNGSFQCRLSAPGYQ